ncbi:hypothetical protein [Anaerocolumna sp. MB42-C2]|uniref:hypothetical protein n=1 Tax=Anaerocolumna sp. MB42-C2 TaxID=3070997 RepID=UPI0027DF9F95|nr:hypothetical protein [Anaerocolumna sp. MB42-C2]WMJ89240.1 hypothetical protein RBU59_06860 [Anaerocolumna sp. MB42-C2]
MKKNHVTRCIFLILLGVIVLAVGIFVISENLKTISGLCIGIGAGFISMNVANLIIILYYKKHPDLKKQSEIESKDERTVAITNKAKAKAFDITVRALIIIPFLLILADSPLWMTLASVALYSFGFGAQIYFTIRYSKEM